MTGTLKGTLEGAAWGAVGAGVAAGIGGVLGHADGILSPELSAGQATIKSTAHGLSRGIISVAQGGNFKAGFASGFGASFFSPGTALGNDTLGETGGLVARTSIAATVGGTASVIGGDKFANGATSGAFVHLFNAEGARLIRSNPYNNNPQSLEERAKYHTQEARMARGETLANALNVYSEPLMVVAGTGIVAVVGSEVLIPLAMMYPEAVLSGGTAIQTFEGYYGGSAPGFDYGSVMSGFESFTGIDIVPEWLKP